jgi:hypothetical protein
VVLIQVAGAKFYDESFAICFAYLPYTGPPFEKRNNFILGLSAPGFNDPGSILIGADPDFAAFCFANLIFSEAMFALTILSLSA